jgi:hypothetical protein
MDGLALCDRNLISEDQIELNIRYQSAVLEEPGQENTQTKGYIAP